MSYFREEIDKLTPYQPGEQPAPRAKVIKLNTNENPYPPSAKAAAVLREFDQELLRLYPKPYADDVRQAIGEALSVPAEWTLVGNGSDELLTMIMRSAAGPGRKVVYPMPTYVLYRTMADLQQAETVEVAFDEEYRLPTDQLLAAGGAVTLVATPNSPSGTVAPNDQLAELAEGLDGLLVIDEAYADFADGNALALAAKYDNVVVLRTLSKGYSLAGLRLGFAIAQPELIAGLSKAKESYNVDAVACAVGATAIRDQAHKDANVAKVVAGRAWLTGELEGLGFKVWPSQANFLLARPPAGNGQEIYQSLKARGILVRYFKQPRLEDKLRITVGTDGQNAALIESLSDMIQ